MDEIPHQIKFNGDSLAKWFICWFTLPSSRCTHWKRKFMNSCGLKNFSNSFHFRFFFELCVSQGDLYSGFFHAVLNLQTDDFFCTFTINFRKWIFFFAIKFNFNIVSPLSLWSARDFNNKVIWKRLN